MNRNFQAVKSIINDKFFGWSTNRKLLIIESDDWGAIRTSDKASYLKLEEAGYDMALSCYNLDALESNSDLSELYSVLNKHVDINGRPACFTANIVTANPDFKAISDGGFETYIYESVDTTCQRVTNSDQVINLWNQGLDAKVFIPQMHCREHLRYWEWMNRLYQGDKETVDTFLLKMCGLPAATSRSKTSFFKTPYVTEDILNKNSTSMSELITPGFQIFNKIFSFMPSSVVAPNVGWTDETERVWASLGVQYIQGGRVQVIDGLSRRRFKQHYLGQKNKHNMMYLVRNCTFEPAKGLKFDQHSALRQICKAFDSNKPAIITSHRVNYISRIKEKNRSHSLAQLDDLLKVVKKMYPNVEFISSHELGEIIRKDNKSNSSKSAEIGL